MIIRIVKMTFKEEEITAFQQLFAERKSLIRNFPGCTHLALWQDKDNPQQFFTYSWWQSTEALDAYRQSHFFDDTWRQTKQKFAARPEAWTVDQLFKD
ncbi:MAG: antibiotic biosynthesis monooxygenase [Chitinophagaceae bacterium]|nr:MAG: antibiotic biosynthesis monooxygenase [Chitinophagaceae bacterium]